MNCKGASWGISCAQGWFVAFAGYCIAALTVVKMAPPGTPVPGLGAGYLVTMGAGLAVSLAVIVATLPFLGRLTRPETARFE